jgi:sec-independent protein translocase protein TatC
MIESENIVKAVRSLARLRKRILLMLFFPALFGIGVYFIADSILKMLVQPLKTESLFFITPLEGFLVKAKIAFVTGFILAFPLIAWSLISICTAGFAKKRRLKLYFLIIPFASLALAGGILFGYRFILPTTINFLLNCGRGFLKPVLSGSEYVSFVMFILLTVGLVFELPLVLVFLSRLGLIQSRTLMQKRGIAILIIFIILAILTPTPDVVTLTAVALPVVLLYELSIWWIFILEKINQNHREASDR